MLGFVLVKKTATEGPKTLKTCEGLRPAVDPKQRIRRAARQQPEETCKIWASGWVMSLESLWRFCWVWDARAFGLSVLKKIVAWSQGQGCRLPIFTVSALSGRSV